MDLDAEVGSVDRDRLTGPVRAALGSTSAEVGDWGYGLVYGGLGMALGFSAIYRFSGTARDGDGVRPWTVILKVLRDPNASGPSDAEVPSAFIDRWDREVSVYRSGMLNDLPPGLGAPRCYAIEQRPAAEWLWLEDVIDETPGRWSVDRFALAARHFGRLNGAYLTDRPIPADPWLVRGLLRARAVPITEFWGRFDQARDTPIGRKIWPGELGDRARRIWDEREWLFDAIDRLPHVVIHGDADRRNLFARRDATGVDQTIAIDWALVGVMPIGSELPPMVTASVLWGQAAADNLDELADRCLAAHVDGLADAGWRGDPRLVEAGFIATAALRHGPMFGAVRMVDMSAEQHAAFARTMGSTQEELIDRWVAVQRFAYDRLESVRHILDAL